MTIIQALEAADKAERGGYVPDEVLNAACIALARAYRAETIGRLRSTSKVS